jgi:type I thyroxine 5'-deiodinase
VPALNALYRQHKDRAAFYAVYIQEAHPTDAWQVANNVQDQVLVASPRTADAREEVAGICVRKLAIELPALIDDMRNSTEQAYTGWPDRLYLIDRDGRVAYKSAPGPFGFRPSELAAALDRTMDQPRAR